MNLKKTKYILLRNGRLYDDWSDHGGQESLAYAKQHVRITFPKTHQIRCYVEYFEINIIKNLRRTPFDGMKQPTPHGGMLGFENVLTLKYKSELCRNHRVDIIYQDKCIEYTTDINGQILGIPLNADQEITLNIEPPCTIQQNS